jgi:DNA-binding NarL/FixJ family response regulator
MVAVLDVLLDRVVIPRGLPGGRLIPLFLSLVLLGIAQYRTFQRQLIVAQLLAALRKMLPNMAKLLIFYSLVPAVVTVPIAYDERINWMRKTRIFLIEDNRILRDGIKAIIDKQADLKIVGATGGNHDTLVQVMSLKPQVVLIDLGLRNANGLRVVATLTKDMPQSKIIGMGLIPSQLDIVEFVEAGASGFILKDATIADVLGTIRAVVRGIRILPPLLTESLFTHVINHALRQGEGKLPNAVRMTKREREIIVLIAEGMSNKEIAQRLNLSTYTVKSHIHNILEKMALHSRLQIATHAYENKGL